MLGIGLALLLYVGYIFLQNKSEFVSPIPNESGIKVLYLSPTQK